MIQRDDATTTHAQASLSFELHRAHSLQIQLQLTECEMNTLNLFQKLYPCQVERPFFLQEGYWWDVKAFFHVSTDSYTYYNLSHSSTLSFQYSHALCHRCHMWKAEKLKSCGLLIKIQRFFQGSKNFKLLSNFVNSHPRRTFHIQLQRVSLSCHVNHRKSLL